MRYGLTAMCIGIGMGGAVIWENPHHVDYGKGPDSTLLRGTGAAVSGATMSGAAVSDVDPTQEGVA